MSLSFHFLLPTLNFLISCHVFIVSLLVITKSFPHIMSCHYHIIYSYHQLMSCHVTKWILSFHLLLSPINILMSCHTIIISFPVITSSFPNVMSCRYHIISCCHQFISTCHGKSLSFHFLFSKLYFIMACHIIII